MRSPIIVKIIGAPIACKEGVKETWREVAGWAASQLKSRFGDRVQTKYYDLFDPQCPPLPPDCELPVVIVDDVVISNGGKISIPLIRKKLENQFDDENSALGITN